MEDFFKTFGTYFTCMVKIEFGRYVLEINLNKNTFMADTMSYGDWHSHPLFELQYVLEGVCRMKIENMPVILEAGRFVLIKPNTYHTTIQENGKPLKKFSLSFRVLSSENKKIVRSSIEEEKALDALLNDSEPIIGHSEEMRERILLITKELQKPEIFTQQSLQSNLTCIMLLILRKIYNKDTVDKKLSFSLDEKRFAMIDYYFNENYQKPGVNSGELAFYLKISGRHLNRILNSLYKCSFNKKLNCIRIQKAMFSLKNSSGTMEEISECVGFSSINYFYKVFKKETGITPAKYRAMSK